MPTKTRTTVVNPPVHYGYYDDNVVTKDANGYFLKSVWTETDRPINCTIPAGLRASVETLSWPSNGPTDRSGINDVLHTKSTVPDLSGLKDMRVVTQSGHVRLDAGTDMRFASTRIPASRHVTSIIADADTWGQWWWKLNSALPDTYTLTAPSRAGELPGLVRKRLDGFHASTTLLESRDLPKLYALLTKRSSLLYLLANPPWDRSLRSFQKWASNAKNSYLAMQYGLKPTVADVRSLSRELSRRKVALDTINFSIALPSTVSRSRSRKYEAPLYPETNSYVRSDKESLKRVDGVRIRARSDRRSDLQNPFLDLSRRFIGLNPLISIWEPMPLSFVVDWFTCLDDILDSIWLKGQPLFEARFWESQKRFNSSTLEFSDGFDVIPYTGPHGSDLDNVRQGNPGRLTWLTQFYSRQSVDPPTVLSSYGTRFGTQKAFNLFLMSVGLRRR